MTYRVTRLFDDGEEVLATGLTLADAEALQATCYEDLTEGADYVIDAD